MNMPRILRHINTREGFFPIYASLALLLITAAAYGGLFYLSSAQKRAQEEVITQIELKQEDLRPRILDQILDLDKLLRNAKTALTGHPFTQQVFHFFEKNTHPRVAFTSFTFTNDAHQVTARGEADGYESLARQIAFFEGDPQVQSIEFGGLMINEKNLVTFSLTLAFKPTLTKIRP